MAVSLPVNHPAVTVAAAGLALGLGFAAAHPLVLGVLGVAIAFCLLLAHPVGLVGTFLLVGIFFGELLRLSPTFEAAGVVGQTVLLGAMLIVAIPHLRDHPPPRLLVIAFSTMALIATVHLFFSAAPLANLLQGLRSLLVPWLFLIAATLLLSPLALKRLLVLGVPVVALEAGLAIYQRRQGVSALLAQGYEYETTIRETGGTLRAFGTMTYGIPFGHTMAIMMMAYVALAVLGPTRALRVTGALGGVLAAVAVAMSANRTAAFASLASILVTMLLAYFVAPSRRRSRALALTLGLGAAVVGIAAATSASGIYSDTRTVGLRLDLWQRVLAAGDPVWGGGPAAAGVAAGGESVGAAVVDNYYLTVALTLGILGATFFVLGLVSLLPPLFRRLSDTAEGWAGFAGTACLLYVMVSMVTLNIWEDYPVVFFALAPIAAAIQRD